MNNEFDFKSYFTKNYGLGDKPTVRKPNFKIKLAHIIAIILSIGFIVLGLIVKSLSFFIIVGIVCVVAIFCFFILIPIIKDKRAIAADKKKAEEWQNDYDYRANNWDALFDKFFEEKINELDPRRNGMKRIGIEESMLKESDSDEASYVAEPFSIYAHGYDSYVRFGKIDGKPRTNENKITWLFFGKNQIYVYVLEFRLDDVHKIERTVEFFYNDIVSIATSIKTVDLKIDNAIDAPENEIIESEEFKVVVPGDSINFAFTSNDTVDSSIQSLKTLIRKKKNG